MAFLSIPNVAIRGIAACVPKNIEENLNLPVFKEGEAVRVINQTGIERKRTVENGTTISDLCKEAFNCLIDKLNWERESIDVLVLVSSSADYITPPTANVLQGLLDLSEECIAFDIRQGCPGWVVGLSTVSSMISLGNLKRAVILCGDVSTLLNSPIDKETRPLFGDAGTATAIEYAVDAPVLQFQQGTRGKDFQAIMTPYGGLRNPVTEEALKFVEYGSNQIRRGIDCRMDGMNVFSFGLSVAPKSVQSLCEYYDIDRESIDYYFFHQANQYMNEKIRKKLKIDLSKVPYSLKNFGNTSGASIPLTIVTQCQEAFSTRKLNNIACAFGVGLAWGSVHFETNCIICPELIEH
ncbi:MULTISPECIES: ketoacyl-ACP synthase III [Bacteroides]|jgi:3-oxoacyl-[acyl-carrier-protein] synthase-3|uniref:ketoacyl-ACP synthase III n=1 Tax=Bacteroides TaxID=816 RepID=UPI000E4F566B|nr:MULTISPECIES: ketoacyl-ACP synthase III [Bacteroides]RHL08522.1 ketoacyl-ACP synthase III [Bacteroides sp. AF39-11AC]